MQHFFALEIEATHRRGEWERAVMAAERRAQVRPQPGRPRWPHLAHQLLARLAALASPRVPVTCGTAAGEPHARSLHVEGGGAPVT